MAEGKNAVTKVIYFQRTVQLAVVAEIHIFEIVLTAYIVGDPNF